MQPRGLRCTRLCTLLNEKLHIYGIKIFKWSVPTWQWCDVKELISFMKPTSARESVRICARLLCTLHSFAAPPNALQQVFTNAKIPISKSHMRLFKWALMYVRLALCYTHLYIVIACRQGKLLKKQTNLHLKAHLSIQLVAC